MRKVVTLYRLKDENIAYPTPSKAQQAAEQNIDDIEPVQFEIPDDGFWQGDLISVELHRGGNSLSGDGIHRGGAWQPAVYGYADVDSVELSRGRINGCIRELGSDRHIQAMELHAGREGFPYRNAKLIRANDIPDV